MAEADAAKTLEYHKANNDDETGILSVLEEVAPEVPLSLGASELENMQIVIRTCCASGESWVAVDGDAIVGVVLAKPDFRERDFSRTRALSLPFIGVNTASQKKGICRSFLLEAMGQRCNPDERSQGAQHPQRLTLTTAPGGGVMA
jgi:hypothetical protein